jgi:hypothetical protein
VPGTAGTPGAKGDTGPAGPIGPAGAAGPAGVDTTGAEIWTRRSSSAAVLVLPGHTVTGANFAWTENAQWRANSALPSIIQFVGGNFKLTRNALVIASVGINAQASGNSSGTVVLVSDDPNLTLGEWGVAYNFDPGQSQNAAVLSAVTCPIRIAGGSIIGFNFIVDASSSVSVKVNRIYYSLEIYAYMP